MTMAVAMAMTLAMIMVRNMNMTSCQSYWKSTVIEIRVYIETVVRPLRTWAVRHAFLAHLPNTPQDRGGAAESI